MKVGFLDPEVSPSRHPSPLILVALSTSNFFCSRHLSVSFTLLKQILRRPERTSERDGRRPIPLKENELLCVLGIRQDPSVQNPGGRRTDETSPGSSDTVSGESRGRVPLQPTLGRAGRVRTGSRPRTSRVCTAVSKTIEPRERKGERRR